MNQSQFIGNLTRDPELRQLKSGKNVCSFTLAVNRKYKVADGQRPTDFFEVVVWEKRGESLAGMLKKGMRVYVRGEMQTYSYTSKDGTKHEKCRLVLGEERDAFEFCSSRMKDEPDVTSEEYEGDDLPFPGADDEGGNT